MKQLPSRKLGDRGDQSLLEQRQDNHELILVEAISFEKSGQGAFKIVLLEFSIDLVDLLAGLAPQFLQGGNRALALEDLFSYESKLIISGKDLLQHELVAGFIHDRLSFRV